MLSLAIVRVPPSTIICSTSNAFVFASSAGHSISPTLKVMVVSSAKGEGTSKYLSRASQAALQWSREQQKANNAVQSSSGRGDDISAGVFRHLISCHAVVLYLHYRQQRGAQQHAKKTPGGRSTHNYCCCCNVVFPQPLESALWGL